MLLLLSLLLSFIFVEAKVDKRDNNGNTPLLTAMEHGACKRIIEMIEPRTEIKLTKHINNKVPEQKERDRDRRKEKETECLFVCPCHSSLVLFITLGIWTFKFSWPVVWRHKDIYKYP